MVYRIVEIESQKAPEIRVVAPNGRVVVYTRSLRIAELILQEILKYGEDGITNVSEW